MSIQEFNYSFQRLGEFAAKAAMDWGAPMPRAIPGVEVADRKISHVSIDSRRIHHPDKTIFVAIPGKNRDGITFIQDAFNKGVRNFIARDTAGLEGKANFLIHEDPVLILQMIAAWHFSFLSPIYVYGITGSNGKTIVKEWLATMLEEKYKVFKSPKSYNSQIGVPLSLIQVDDSHEMVFIEVGISEEGEMDRLARLVAPDNVIFTHFGDAHSEGFASEEEKLNEKLKLIQPKTQWVYVGSQNEKVLKALKEKPVGIATAGFREEDDCTLSNIRATGTGWKFQVDAERQTCEMELNISGKAALENVALVIMVSLGAGLKLDEIARRLPLLHPVSMRMELISDNPDITVINDAYNADAASIYNAFSIAAAETNQPGKALILSDLEHQGDAQRAVQEKILKEAIKIFGKPNIYLVGPVFHEIGKDKPGIHSFSTTSDLLEAVAYDEFLRKVVLIKGARKFQLERVIPFLSRKAVASWFAINLNNLSHNYRQFKSRLNPGTKMMAMVKAFAYGSGSWEIAQALEAENVDYLAVAYTAGGIDLRVRGIEVPIMVMNADENSLREIFVHRLEPEVYNLKFLERVRKAGLEAGESVIRVHIKVDTGMRRLGFRMEEADALIAYLDTHPEIRVAGVMSHLSAADDPLFDAHTQAQIEAFDAFYEKLEPHLPEKPMRHILNSAGILRFPEAQYEMVRLGIGLYGVPPCETDLDLREIGSLRAVISQIHDFPAGVPVGYGCSQITIRDSRIATIPIGYADGVRRSLSNGKASFLVRGRRAPVFGRVCMDMIMLDVTDIPGVQEGDEVVLIGQQGKAQISVSEIAELCDTIPYEILTGISRRVRRLYVRE